MHDLRLNELSKLVNVSNESTLPAEEGYSCYQLKIKNSDHFSNGEQLSARVSQIASVLQSYRFNLTSELARVGVQASERETNDLVILLDAFVKECLAIVDDGSEVQTDIILQNFQYRELDNHRHEAILGIGISNNHCLTNLAYGVCRINLQTVTLQQAELLVNRQQLKLAEAKLVAKTINQCSPAEAKLLWRCNEKIAADFQQLQAREENVKSAATILVAIAATFLAVIASFAFAGWIALGLILVISIGVPLYGLLQSKADACVEQNTALLLKSMNMTATEQAQNVFSTSLPSSPQNSHGYQPIASVSSGAATAPTSPVSCAAARYPQISSFFATSPVVSADRVNITLAESPASPVTTTPSSFR